MKKIFFVRYTFKMYYEKQRIMFDIDLRTYEKIEQNKKYIFSNLNRTSETLALKIEFQYLFSNNS